METTKIKTKKKSAPHAEMIEMILNKATELMGSGCPCPVQKTGTEINVNVTVINNNTRPRGWFTRLIERFSK